MSQNYDIKLTQNKILAHTLPYKLNQTVGLFNTLALLNIYHPLEASHTPTYTQTVNLHFLIMLLLILNASTFIISLQLHSTLFSCTID